MQPCAIDRRKFGAFAENQRQLRPASTIASTPSRSQMRLRQRRERVTLARAARRGVDDLEIHRVNEIDFVRPGPDDLDASNSPKNPLSIVKRVPNSATRRSPLARMRQQWCRQY